MSIIVNANPRNLTWGDFTVVPNRIVDPADGELVEAYTAFNYNIPNLPARVYGSKFGFADPMTITITPTASVWSGATQTSALLSHEQWHYDLGIVLARSLAKKISRVRKKTRQELVVFIQNAAALHFTTRAGLLQKRYDLDTRHGTQPRYQRIWKDRMRACLANPNITQLGGFYL